MRRFLILLCLLVLALTGTVAAGDVVARQAEVLDLQGLERAAGEAAGEIALKPEIDLNGGLQYLLDAGRGQIFGITRKAVRSGMLLLVIVLLCGLADGMNEKSGQGIEVITIVGALAVTAVAVADVGTLIGLGRRALDDMELFSKVLLPTMTAAAAAGGAPGGAAARQLATMLFSDVLLTLINRLLLPLVYAYIAASAAYAALGNEGLKRIGHMLKWLVSSILAAVLLVFVSYLTVSGVIAGTADAVTIKAAKFTVSSVVPVVGGILSDAAETVLAGAGILRNAIGVFGMLAVLGICLAPFLQLGIHYLAYKLTAALTATVSAGRIGALIDSIGGAFGLVLGMTGASAILLLISMVSAISVVTM
ncbi:MAG: stage III sporulation protein AE [Pseudoflavonifractor sp.]